MVRHNGTQHLVNVDAYDRLAKELISSTLDLCEKRIHSRNLENTHKMSLQYAAMSVKYAIEAFQSLTRMSEREK